MPPATLAPHFGNSQVSQHNPHLYQYGTTGAHPNHDIQGKASHHGFAKLNEDGELYRPGPKLYLNLLILAWCIISPALVFITVDTLGTSSLRYSNRTVSLVLIWLLWIPMVFVPLKFNNPLQIRYLGLWRVDGSLVEKRHRMGNFCFWSYVVAWSLAFFMAEWNFRENFEPYWDITRLNVFPSVDPAAYHGQQMMDMGKIEFIPGSHLDLSKSFGFKNGHTYCIAPVVAPVDDHNGNKNMASNMMDHYDFWAVGIDCCSAHTNDFHCGEFANTRAHKGLRLMRDDQRHYFRLALEEASASYNLKADFPLFLYWMENPEDELKAHWVQGMFNYTNGIMGFLIFQCVSTFFFAMFFEQKTNKEAAEAEQRLLDEA